MKSVPIFALSAFALLATACGERVTVETGEVGKVLGTSGLERKTYQPSSFRLDWCGPSACPKLVRLQVSKSTTVLNIDTLYLPESNVDIRNVQVGIVFQVKEDEDSIAKIYDEVKPESVGGPVMLISAEKVYETYLARKAPDAIVTELRKHTVEEVLTNVPEIADATKVAISEMLGDAPIEVTELGFPNGIGEVPKEVIQAKRRLFAVDEEKARSVRALAAELEVEAQRQRVQKVRAENDVINARIAGVPYDVYVKLKNEERFADAADAMAEAVAEGSHEIIVQAPAPQPVEAPKTESK
jgi:hypothetical protein